MRPCPIDIWHLAACISVSNHCGCSTLNVFGISPSLRCDHDTLDHCASNRFPASIPLLVTGAMRSSDFHHFQKTRRRARGKKWGSIFWQYPEWLGTYKLHESGLNSLCSPESSTHTSDMRVLAYLFVLTISTLVACVSVPTIGKTT